MNKKYLIGFVIGFISIGIISFIALGLNSNPSITSSTIKVVAAENFWGDIISQIGGSHVSVTSIISDPNTDPHLYESNAQNALAVSQASLIIENGLGYDDFIDKLTSASKSNGRDVIKVSSVLGISGNDANPHLWYNTANLPKVTLAIENELVKIDPSNKTTYETNTAKFNQSLQPIIDTINTIKSKYPNSPVAYTERVPGYILIAAGLDIKSPAGFASAIEDGNDPSPADTLAMENLINNHQIKVLLYNAQVTSPTTQHIHDLAVTAGIPVVGVTETMPANEATFQTWQLNQAQALLKALGN
jgi:zinc/manganese transport system substrate-binding protein